VVIGVSWFAAEGNEVEEDKETGSPVNAWAVTLHT